MAHVIVPCSIAEKQDSTNIASVTDLAWCCSPLYLQEVASTDRIPWQSENPVESDVQSILKLEKSFDMVRTMLLTSEQVQISLRQQFIRMHKAADRNVHHHSPVINACQVGQQFDRGKAHNTTGRGS